MNRYISVLLIVFFLISGCKDIYNADIDATSGKLVVEGLITDQPGPYFVKLSRSTPFGSPHGYYYEYGAKVTVTSSKGEEARFYQNGRGVYMSEPDFRGKVGETYILNIELLDGSRYQSAPQTIQPSFQIESVSAELANKIVYFPSNVSNNIFEFDVKVGNVFFETLGNGTPLKYRLVTHLVADYRVEVGQTIFRHCWVRQPVTDYMGNDVAQLESFNVPQKKNIAFIPVSGGSMIHIGFPDYNAWPPEDYYGNIRVLLNYIYVLNDEAFRFHDARNKQLTDEGRFFDPIAAQVQGNIKSLDDPDELVFGLFEASSLVYLPIDVKLLPNKAEAFMVHFVDTIRSTGCYTNQMPPFFRDMYNFQ